MFAEKGLELHAVPFNLRRSTFVYSVQPSMFTGIPESELPPLFQNGTAQSIENANLTYEAKYGGGNGILTTA